LGVRERSDSITIAGSIDGPGVLEKRQISVPGAQAAGRVAVAKEVLDWFRAQGQRYQSRMTAVL